MNIFQEKSVVKQQCTWNAAPDFLILDTPAKVVGDGPNSVGTQSSI